MAISVRAAAWDKRTLGVGALNLPRIAIRYDGSSLRTHDPVVCVAAWPGTDRVLDHLRIGVALLSGNCERDPQNVLLASDDR
jgi:hypothetical protein